MNDLKDIRKEFADADRDELLKEILDLRDQLDDMESDKDDIEEEKDQYENALDTAREYIERIMAGKYLDLDQFIRFLQLDNLYTEELENYIKYFVRCHNDIPGDLDLEELEIW